MLITEQAANFALNKADALTVADVCIGVGYTGVKLSDGSGGCCYTIRGELGPKCGVIEGAGTLIGRPAADLIKMAISVKPAEASLGVATINAVLNNSYSEAKNALDEMAVKAGDKIGIIGYFYPVVKRFQETAADIYVFERHLTDDFLLPDWAENIYLPECDVVVITGVTFINKTIDYVLSLCTKSKEIVIMGASTIMAPDILKKYGVTLLAGSRVSDPDRLLKVIAQGGGGLDVLDCTEKLCLRLEDRRK
ncbi:MAG: DUF364 domain-containing protein [Clostridia bacterium]|nr:DUF364 domain-containing protein [Clostridia bacterium]